MKQVFLSGQGQIDVFDVPVPSRLKGGVLVQNAYSLISAGTEGSAVTKNEGLKGRYEKILKSRDKMGLVWNMVKTQGLSNTFDLIQNKLNDYNPLGYSCSGIVVDVDDPKCDIKEGDRVACMGTGFANHSEFVAIPQNLVVHMPDSISFDQSAFAAIGCIAMQGIRRLELTPGERVAIIGLGLIGQIALKLAIAMGYQVFGFDIDDRRVNHAKKNNQTENVWNSASIDPTFLINEVTSGTGVDGVVICASAKMSRIVNQSFSLCRKRGRVSVVGDVGLELERTKMYAKELEVRLSCSYGIGRYDPTYEIEGNDYPFPYVRWTERRNLEYFLTLIAENRIQLGDLITEKVSIDEAKKAYSIIKNENEDAYGILFDYNLPDRPKLPKNPFVLNLRRKRVANEKKKINIALIGAGSYAKNIHVPSLRNITDINLKAVASKSGASAAIIAKKENAAYVTADVSEVFKDENIDAVIVSTRHSSHAKLVVAALNADKHVFVEKPMAISVKDCLEIVNLQQKVNKTLRVGFNRRFCPMLQTMKNAIGIGRKIFTIRVNVGPIANHWSNTINEGGRLLGEGVHFFDLSNWMHECEPAAISAHYLGKPDLLNPDVSVSINYEDGSVSNIVYTTIGNTSAGKEYFELNGNGRTVIIDNYKKMKSFGCKAVYKRKDKNNKGQMAVIGEFVKSIKTGCGEAGADAVAGFWATAMVKAALKSSETNSIVNCRFLGN